MSKRNRHIDNPYLRALMADELNGVRRFINKHHPSEDVRHWMSYEVYNCFGRVDQHIRHFGIGVLTGESNGAFPTAWEKK